MKSKIRVDQPLAGRLKPLRDGLLALHKTLLDSERGAYEHNVRKIASPMDLLGLLMNDPWFVWLREVSSLVVAIDEALAGDQTITKDEADGFFAATRNLLRPQEDGEGFGKHYDDAMQRDPNIILAHGEMMRLLTRLEAQQP